ncbi:MAG: Bcr/CflA family drug resistance efflux transporter [Candidatus Amoebophilus sp. 36-38]|nr:MAG: Bcr/CflA family drug resistance efflux transporter [Candidatus Amoebophilus sp. 36-38]
MAQIILPAIWLIILIAGLPQFAETVYTPTLPEIANALKTSVPMVEYTLTIYLLGFAIGTLFWGKLSDSLGRKPCVIAGLLIFILGCISCYFSNSITMLLISRFVQAFGGSIGSVLAQTICRDAFQGPRLGKVYASVGSSLAVFPAIGPVIGGTIAANFAWFNIFLVVLAFAIIVTTFVIIYLPETHRTDLRKSVSIKEVLFKLVKDKRAMGFGLIVGACNGIMFSYFAEGSFYLIKLLGLHPSVYGLSFIPIAISTMLGGMVSKRLHNSHNTYEILRYGLLIIFIASSLFSMIIGLHTYFISLSPTWIINITILAQMCIMFGVCMATSNALALALVFYKDSIGTASSLFGFFYYACISLFTFVMGYLHNATLLIMPLYFLAISTLMLGIQKLMIAK